MMPFEVGLLLLLLLYGMKWLVAPVSAMRLLMLLVVVGTQIGVVDNDILFILLL